MELSDTIPYTDIQYIQLIVAIVILVVGYLLIKVFSRLLRKGMMRTKLPPLLVDFLGRVFTVLLYVVLVLVFVGALGFDVGALVVGLLAVAGLILGLGMQDTITNFFAGLWLALIRPIRKDEWVTVSGFSGKINSVGIMSTEMISADNTHITLPNKTVWGNPISNFTRMPTRRVEIPVGTSYSGDVDRAIKVAMDLMASHPKVLSDPAPDVVVTELGDSSVNISMRAWVNNPDYWSVKWDLTRGVFEAFNREGVEIPFPQMDVHLDKKE